VPGLKSPRHEQFAQLVAAGKTPAEAYAAVGYAEKAAYTCEPRLLKCTSVEARVAELRQTVALAVAFQTAINRNNVLGGLWEIATNGNNESARVRALELCGKALGMFVEPKIDWDGDPKKLTNEQLLTILYTTDKIQVGEEEAQKRLEARCNGSRYSRCSGQIISRVIGHGLSPHSSFCRNGPRRQGFATPRQQRARP
jgi:hypothetical protein